MNRCEELRASAEAARVAVGAFYNDFNKFLSRPLPEHEDIR